VESSDLVAAYEGSTGQTWVLTSPELELLVEKTVRRVLAEQVPPKDD
jgi:hypothetical protein